MITLFVYGTLLTGEGNWSWALKPQKGKPDSLSPAKLYHLGGFPGMKPSENINDSVKGEVFQITPEQLRRIDNLEGFDPNRENNTFYFRTTVKLESGIKAETYIYFRDVSEDQLIPSGDWRKRNETT
jgi:gamma-glutamylcyclotransferase (GGCT)/AIG2-like uncharacterized protein YtfP